MIKPAWMNFDAGLNRIIVFGSQRADDEEERLSKKKGAGHWLGALTQSRFERVKGR
jgi:hypothetical protein